MGRILYGDEGYRVETRGSSGTPKMNYYPEIRGVWTDSFVDGKTINLQKRVKAIGKGWIFRVEFLSEQTTEIVEEVIGLHPNNSGIFQIGNLYIIPETANKHLKAFIVRAGLEVNKRAQYSFSFFLRKRTTL